MKLLLDENLSRQLVPFHQHDYPGSSQVLLLGMESASDADFEELSLVWGQPPKVIWLKTRNQSRATTLKILLENRLVIEDALLNRGQACIEVSGV